MFAPCTASVGYGVKLEASVSASVSGNCMSNAFRRSAGAQYGYRGFGREACATAQARLFRQLSWCTRVVLFRSRCAATVSAVAELRVPGLGDSFGCGFGSSSFPSGSEMLGSALERDGLLAPDHEALVKAVWFPWATYRMCFF